MIGHYARDRRARGEESTSAIGTPASRGDASLSLPAGKTPWFMLVHQGPYQRELLAIMEKVADVGHPAVPQGALVRALQLVE